MKKKLGIKSFLIINCLLTFAILFAAMQLASVTAYQLIKNVFFKDGPINYSNFSMIYNKDFNKINIDIIEEFGCWVEILDENRKVIFVKGKKLDTAMQYSERELLALTSSDENSSGSPYSCNLSPVEGKNGEPYIFMLKYDKNRFSNSIVYTPSIKNSEDIPFILKTTGVKTVILLLYLLIGIYIYSIISSKFITKPLGTYVTGIKKMGELDYGTRVHVNSLKELEEVENEFNRMARKLQEVEEEKKKLDESKKRLLTDISHDLKTPITSIRGFSKALLEENITPEQQKRFLNIIHNKAVYSTTLIDDLFQLSKLELSEYSLSSTESDFNEWLRRLVTEYYEEFRNKGFKLDIDISEHIVFFNFDEKLMKRAISNIINNTLKHNKAGTAIGISSCLESNDLVLRIWDDGIGIEEGIRDKIFEPFIKAEEKKSEGSGLGLAITRKIVEKHGGTISLLCDVPGKTVFEIRFPLKF